MGSKLDGHHYLHYHVCYALHTKKPGLLCMHFSYLCQVPYDCTHRQKLLLGKKEECASVEITFNQNMYNKITCAYTKLHMNTPTPTYSCTHAHTHTYTCALSLSCVHTHTHTHARALSLESHICIHQLYTKNYYLQYTPNKTLVTVVNHTHIYMHTHTSIHLHIHTPNTLDMLHITHQLLVSSCKLRHQQFGLEVEPLSMFLLSRQSIPCSIIHMF